MYTAKLHIYLIGFSQDSVALISNIEPLPSFQHSIHASESIDSGMISEADLILLRSSGPETAQLASNIAAQRKSGADIILVASAETFTEIGEAAGALSDFWEAPLDDALLAFHFKKWQADRKLQADLWQTDQFLNTTIDSIPNLIWYKTRDGIHEKVNDSFCATVRKTKEQVQGQGHAYIWDVEHDDPACIESENEVMASGRTCVSEEAVQTSEGDRLLTTYKSPLYNIDGTVMGTVGVGIDITQERAYEQSLIDKNQALETIFRSLDCGVLTHSVDGTRILGVNQKALDILGYATEQEMMDDGFDTIARSVIEEDRDRMIDQIHQLRNVGDSNSTQYRVRHSDGSLIHVMGDMKLIENDGERYIQRFLLDITKQKNLEAQKELVHHSLIQALSSDYMVVCSFQLDSDTGEVLQVSEDLDAALSDIFAGDIALDQTMNAYIDKRVDAEDQEMVRSLLTPENIRRELSSHNRFDRIYRANVNDALQYRQLSVTGVRAGEENFIVVGLRNIDQQIREELEQKTLLEEALGYANRANEAKSTFLSNMSHDIRTPMNAIVGFTELATRHIGDPERVKEYLSKIKTSGNHLLNLINDVLDMGRIEQGKLSLDEGPCDLNEVFAALEEILAPEVESKQLEFDVTTELTHSEVLCDKVKLNQILMNLLSNSVKFTPAGGTVRLSLTELPANDIESGCYRVIVSDTGIGMAPEFLEQIYDPFERERTQTISGIQGSGLGMAIVKNLVNMMGGTIQVESEVGVGTTFTVIFTFKLISARDTATAEKDERSALFQAERAQNYHILLVDDNMLNREIAVELLSDAGFAITTAIDGKDAVEQLASSEPGTFDLVLMDIQMPIMNGYEAARAIRALPNKEVASVPILAVTADAFDEDRQRALEAGMNGHLPKPIEVDKLFGVLDTLLD